MSVVSRGLLSPLFPLSLTALIVCGGPSTGGLRAFAAESEPDPLIPRALELRRKGDDQGALPLLQEAFQKTHSARAAGQLGFCHQGLGQWAEAENYLTVALDKGEKGKDPWVVKNHSVIAEALGVVRSHVGRVEVIGDPPGAEVAINANVVGRLPLPAPVHVSNGEVEVEVHAAGYAGKTKSFHIDGGQYQRVVLRLEPQPQLPPHLAVAGQQPMNPADHAVATDPGASPPSASPLSSPEGGSSDATAGADTVSSRHGTRRALKWIAWGASAVGAGVGIYGAVTNRNRVASFGEGCGLDATGAPHADTAGTTDAQCIDRKKAYETATTVAVVGFIGAAAFTAAGFALWATEPEEPSGSTVAWRACLPSLGPRLEPGAGCIFHF
jgi:hypothetical protein